MIFRKRTKRKVLKYTAAFLAVNMLVEIGSPAIAWALTSGPAQPEFSSFEPVTTTNMVDPFSGSFTYNLPVMEIPGPSGGGYAVSLSYHSGVQPEQEASWVGLGWTLNPGAIMRGKQGVADDANGTWVKTWNKARPNRTVGIGVSAGEIEAYSYDLSALNLGAGLRYNNYRGLSRTLNIGVNTGIGTVSASIADGEPVSFSASINFSGMIEKDKQELEKAKEKLEAASCEEEDQCGKDVKALTQKLKHTSAGASQGSALSNWGSSYGLSLIQSEARNIIVAQYEGVQTYFSLKGQLNFSALHLGFEGGINASYSSQRNIELDSALQFGSMYSENAINGGNSVSKMDYGVEKETTFNSRDQFLPIPYNNPDVFSISGEGVGGGFNLFNNYVGHYLPKSVTSRTDIVNGNLDLSLGANLEPIGPTASIGYNEVSVGNWDSDKRGNTGDYQFGSALDESTYFRFNSDMGGNVEVTGTDSAVRAKLVMGRIPWLIDDLIPSTANSGQRSQRSSYVGYSTQNEMNDSILLLDDATDGVFYRAYNKSASSRNFVDRSSMSAGFGASLGEFSIVNEDGNYYNYGLPVYGADEKSLSYDVEGITPINQYLVYRDISANHNMHTILGEERTAPEATSFLITSITTPDYIDRTYDGPTADDFGGWTKFNYDRAFGSNDKEDNNERSNWYHWRFPYTGLSYQRGTMFDPRDDLGVVQAGNKEIYYLSSIETKTHVAFFITNDTDTTITKEDGTIINLVGSGTDRSDGLEAADDVTAANSSTAKGNGKLRRLEKIVLYAVNADREIIGNPLKTSNFEYETPTSALCQDIPNSSVANGGKLTLKRVWFEYENIAHSRIRPYEFSYAYKDLSASTALSTKYPDLVDYGDGLNENPDYSPYAIDGWGNYRSDGDSLYEHMKPWVQQTGVDTSYDPAAWNLKGITLPTGGEILVQYEQNDYRYVQDKTACQMISLKDKNTSSIVTKDERNSDNKYYLSLDDADLDTDENGSVSTAEVTAYTEVLNKYFSNEKVYFKFLYQLEGSTDPDLDVCTSEYITGYAGATAVRDGDNIYIEFEDKRYAKPRQVCKDFYKKNARGLSLNSTCSNGITDETEGNDAVDVAKSIKRNHENDDESDESGHCKEISLPHSYFRLPVMRSKKGSGIRVKRLLMYDSGIESGDESLVGSEYFYEQDGESSGVATNEPAGIREENALITFMKKRTTQTIADKIISGQDKDRFEGPLGESLLPTASVGYSRVVVKNIHSGKTTTGFTESKYHTCRDFPMWKGTDVTDIAQDRDLIMLPLGILSYGHDNRWQAQGYRFVLNDMHGKMASTTTYIGDYTEGTNYSDYPISSQQKYEYTAIGEKVDVMDNTGNITNQYLGRQEQVAMEMKQVKDETFNFGIQADPSLGLLGPFPIPSVSFLPYLNYNDKEYNRHVTSKVVRYATFVKKIETTQDNVRTITENLVFDGNTGQPVITRTGDGYDALTLAGGGSAHNGKYINYTLPAAKVYRQMGQKATGERYVLEGEFFLYDDYLGAKEEWLSDGDNCHVRNSFINIQDLDNLRDNELAGQFAGSGNHPLDGEANRPIFEERASLLSAIQDEKVGIGDLILLTDGSGNKALFFINEIDDFYYQRIYIQPLSFVANDLITNCHNPKFTRLEVIRSGHTNELKLATAQVTTYGADTTRLFSRSSGGAVQLGDSLESVINASIQTYSDDWYNYALTRDYENVGYHCQNANVFETGARGKWRPRASYVYEDERVHAADNKSYSGGRIQDTYLTSFDFIDSHNPEFYSHYCCYTSSVGEYMNEPENGTPWVRTNKITMYSPNGEPLEESDILGVHSTAKFGYSDNVPVLVANNAPYYAVEFDGFEDDTGSNITSEKSHSGSYSYKLDRNATYTMDALEAETDILDSATMKIKFWVNTREREIDDLANNLSVYMTSEDLDATDTGSVVIPIYASLQRVATVGEWVLFQTEVAGLQHQDNYYDQQSFNQINQPANTEANGRGPGIEYVVSIKNTGTSEIYLDDIRVQPPEAQMITYVYDRENLRLLASFNDQHFGLFYQYNAEGQLVRKLIETERGMKTITETQYNAPLTQRNP